MEMVRLDEPPEFTDDGLKPAVAPEGSPDALRATVWADPEVVLVFTVAVTDDPACTLADAGLSEMEKSLPTLPTALFHRAKAIPSALRLSAVALILAVVSHERW